MRKEADDEDCVKENHWDARLLHSFKLQQTQDEDNHHASDVSSVLCLRILQLSAAHALNFSSAILKLFRHQRVQNSDDREWQKVVDGRLDYRYVPDENFYLS